MGEEDAAGTGELLVRTMNMVSFRLAAVVLSTVTAAVPAMAAEKASVADYLKMSTNVILLGHACFAQGKAKGHPELVVKVVSDLSKLGYAPVAAGQAVSSLIAEKSPETDAVLAEEAAADPAAAAYFCDSAYPERVRAFEALRDAAGLN